MDYNSDSESVSQVLNMKKAYHEQVNWYAFFVFFRVNQPRKGSNTLFGRKERFYTKNALYFCESPESFDLRAST